MSFLVVLKKSGEIEEIKWSDPIYLVVAVHTNFIDLVIEEDRKALMDELRNSSISIICSTKEYHFIDYESCISLSFQKVEENIFVFGYEGIPKSMKEYQKIISRFMGTLKENYSETIEMTNDSVRYQFEKIQVLNSELIDTKRLLQKNNRQIERLNNELNNRLVKDALTGLLSKYQYSNEMEYLTKKNPDKYGIFTFIDIDDFKSINDQYGHGVGDKYLIEFGKRLQAIQVLNTIAIRIAGDEFGLFTYGIESFDESLLLEFWEKIQEILLKPMELDKNQFTFSISAGMAVYGRDTKEIYELIEFADYAMYKVKKSGKNGFSIFQKSDYLKLKMKG